MPTRCCTALPKKTKTTSTSGSIAVCFFSIQTVDRDSKHSSQCSWTLSSKQHRLYNLAKYTVKRSFSIPEIQNLSLRNNWSSNLYKDDALYRSLYNASSFCIVIKNREVCKNNMKFGLSPRFGIHVAPEHSRSIAQQLAYDTTIDEVLQLLPPRRSCLHFVVMPNDLILTKCTLAESNSLDSTSLIVATYIRKIRLLMDQTSDGSRTITWSGSSWR